jgi:hypothetical protein
MQPAVVASFGPDPTEDRVAFVSQLATATPVLIIQRAARDGAVSVLDRRAGTCHAGNRIGRRRAQNGRYGVAPTDRAVAATKLRLPALSPCAENLRGSFGRSSVRLGTPKCG